MKFTVLSLLVIASLSSLTLTAQLSTASYWTQIRSGYSPNPLGIFKTSGVPDAASTAPGPSNDATWTDASGKLWMFGGYFGGPYNTVWSYNPATNQWTWVNGSNVTNAYGRYGTKGVAGALNTPGARSSVISWKDALGNFWIFGGQGYDSMAKIRGVYLDEIWKYDPLSNEWTWISGASTGNQPANYGIKGVQAPSNSPGGRVGSAAWTDRAGNFWLFGGSAGNLYFNDLWKYNPVTNQWTWISGSNKTNQLGIYGTKGTSNDTNTPGGRVNGVGGSDNAGNIMLFGGSGYAGSTNTGVPLDPGNLLNDTWKYDPVASQWTWVNGSNGLHKPGIYDAPGIPSSNNTPGGTTSAAYWSDTAGNIWMFGGFGIYSWLSLNYPYNSVYIPYTMNTVWRYTISSNQWAIILGGQAIPGGPGYVPGARVPSGRRRGASWIDNAGSLWVYGGSSGYPHTYIESDLWRLNSVLQSPLPVTLGGLKAFPQNSGIRIEWNVENESGIKEYQIERSTDGTGYTKIGTVPAIGNNNSKLSYNWLDLSFQEGNIFYRIRSNGADGEVKYSSIASITVGSGKTRFGIFPNPVINNKIQLQFFNQPNGNYHMRLFSYSGHVLQTESLKHESGSSSETIRLNSQLKKGNYYLEITAPDGSRSSLKLVY